MGSRCDPCQEVAAGWDGISVVPPIALGQVLSSQIVNPDRVGSSRDRKFWRACPDHDRDRDRSRIAVVICKRRGIHDSAIAIPITIRFHEHDHVVAIITSREKWSRSRGPDRDRDPGIK